MHCNLFIKIIIFLSCLNNLCNVYIHYSSIEKTDKFFFTDVAFYIEYFISYSIVLSFACDCCMYVLSIGRFGMSVIEISRIARWLIYT